MKAAQLDPQPRRLLRHLGRIDPQPTLLQPREVPAADDLVAKGLARRDGPGPILEITDAGREALR